MKVFEHALGRTILGNDGIMIEELNEYGASGKYTLEEMIKAEKDVEEGIIKEFGEIPPSPVLIRGQNVKMAKKEVRDYAAQNPKDYHLAIALVTGSGLSKIVANLYLKFSNPSTPTKLFTDEGKAIEWLKGFLKK